jgi:hypothetical protein
MRTASSRIPPVKTSCQFESMWSSDMPFASVANTSVPSTVPTTEPRPPAIEVPPMTTAVTASSSSR